MSLLIFILILVALILVHEFGHFIVAKLFGIRVDEFGIFFPPRLLSVKWGETLYTLNVLPFGGFVKIFGENANEAAGDPRSFAYKSKWKQAAVIVAGIVFNLLFAWGLLTAGYLRGIPTAAEHNGVGTVQDARATIVAVLPASPADKAGLKAGDTVTSVLTGRAQLEPGANSQQVQDFIATHQEESIGFSVVRDGKEVGAIAKPVEGLVSGKKVVGVELGDVGILKLSLPLALVQGAYLGKEITVATASGLVGFFSQIVRGTANFAEVSGPIGIVGMGGTAVREGFVATIILTALISINLAIINIIPIPGLDGGRLLFIAIEAITKRPISPRVSLALTVVGFGLLVLLMLVVSFHDVARLIRPA
jgi:regulator of sigma E protease